MIEASQPGTRGCLILLRMVSMTGHLRELNAFLTSSVTRTQRFFFPGIEAVCASMLRTLPTADSVLIPFLKPNWFGALLRLSCSSRCSSSLWSRRRSSSLSHVSIIRMGLWHERVSGGLSGLLRSSTSRVYVVKIHLFFLILHRRKKIGVIFDARKVLNIV